MIERSVCREVYPRTGELRLRIEIDLREERLHLIKRRRTLANLEHCAQIADRIAAPHTDLSRRARMPGRPAKMHMPRGMHIVEIWTKEMHMAIDRKIHIQDDIRQRIFRIRK